MKFVDQAVVTVRSGKGGPGCTSFRRERYVEKGGPDGGDGGDGGQVILKVSPRKRTLFDYHRQKFFKAENGAPGQGRQKHGRNGKDVIIELPPGTTVSDPETGKLLADLTRSGEMFTIAKGGRGGKGNKHFATSTHQTPRFSQPGTDGTELKIKLELKLIADVGIVGLPNAGKSTLISRISNARPKVADYPFTTVVPSLGMVVPESGDPFAVADIPGLIKGAHKGTGLGIAFLKHVERTSLLVHLIDANEIDTSAPLQAYNLINRELSMHSSTLAEKRQIVVLNKVDLSGTQRRVAQFRKQCPNSDIFSVSAVTGKGVNTLINALAEIVAKR